jgi:hypothetical protein
MDFCTTWIKRVLREGEKVLKGRDAVSYAMAFSVVRAAPTGFLYARYILRYNMRRANAQVLLEAAERFGTLLESATSTTGAGANASNDVVVVDDESEIGAGSRSLIPSAVPRGLAEASTGSRKSGAARHNKAPANVSIGGQQRTKHFAASLAGFGPQSRSFDYSVYDMPIEMDLNGIIVDDAAAPKTLRATLAKTMRPKG